MKTKIFICFAIVALFFACKKDKDDPATPAPTPAATYFIEGTVDGVKYRAEYVCPYAGCDMSTGNYSDFMYSITMQRTMSATNDAGWDIHINDVFLDSWTLPVTLNASSSSGNEYLDLSFYTGDWNSDNNYLVDGVTLGDNSFHMTITSKTNDIIQGTFSGELRNGSDPNLTKTVTNGKFKVKLVRI